MKGKYAGINFVMMIIVLSSGCLWIGPEIIIKTYDTPPGQYVELSKEELKEYSTLEKAIKGDGCKIEDKSSWHCKILNSNELEQPNPVILGFLGIFITLTGSAFYLIRQVIL